jgi:hypothetical protein
VLDASNAMTLGDDVANDDSYRHDSPPLSAMNPAALPAARGARGVYSPVRVRFYEAYRGDALMRQMDAVVCSHPVASCELYLPLGLPLVLFVTTRFDLGRLYSADALNRWIQTVRAVSGEAGPGGGGGGEGPPGVVIANNLYDAGYVEYFTGVRPVVLPSLCRDTGGALWMWPLARREVMTASMDANDASCPCPHNLTAKSLDPSRWPLKADPQLLNPSPLTPHPSPLAPRPSPQPWKPGAARCMRRRAVPTIPTEGHAQARSLPPATARTESLAGR